MHLTWTPGPYGYYPGQADVYTYRLKFVLGDAESAYVESSQITTIVTYEVYLPLVLRSS